MTSDNVQEILALGDKEPTVISLNAQHKSEIHNKQMINVMSEMRKHLTKKKNIHVILVKE